MNENSQTGSIYIHPPTNVSVLQASAGALFQGCGFVPDVLALQAWLECAWKSGIDTAGGNLLGNTMQGSNQWIGATECAALLRLFGFKAQVVDFTGAVALQS